MKEKKDPLDNAAREFLENLFSEDIPCRLRLSQERKLEEFLQNERNQTYFEKFLPRYLLKIKNSSSFHETIFILGAQIRNVLNRLENKHLLIAKILARIKEVSRSEMSENFLNGFEGRRFDGETVEAALPAEPKAALARSSVTTKMALKIEASKDRTDSKQNTVAKKQTVWVRQRNKIILHSEPAKAESTITPAPSPELA